MEKIEPQDTAAAASNQTVTATPQAAEPEHHHHHHHHHNPDRNPAFDRLMRNIFAWMAVALAITGFAADQMAHSTELLTQFYTSPVACIVLFIVLIGIVMGFSSQIRRMSTPAAMLVLIIFSIVNGLTLSFIILSFTSVSLGRCFYLLALTSACMAGFNTLFTKHFHREQRFAIMGSIGLIIVIFINWYSHANWLNYIICVFGVIYYDILTIYDAHRIKKLLGNATQPEEVTRQMTVRGALTLYLDAINIYIYLLRQLGKKIE